MNKDQTLKTPVGILIIDDDKDSQMALRQVLDSEGWLVRVVPLASQGLEALASGEWTLVLVNVAMAGVKGPLFATLRDLAQADADLAGAPRKRARVLFLVPELAAKQAQPALEAEGLPYVLKPFHLHDFLEKISDLLLEAQAISEPIRQMRIEQGSKQRPQQRGQHPSRDRRQTKMFASRDDYQMTEEEITEFEKQEEEERKKKQKKGEKEQEREYI